MPASFLHTILTDIMGDHLYVYSMCFSELLWSASYEGDKTTGDQDSDDSEPSDEENEETGEQVSYDFYSPLSLFL